jgi:hypothetical protein
MEVRRCLNNIIVVSSHRHFEFLKPHLQTEVVS